MFSGSLTSPHPLPCAAFQHRSVQPRRRHTQRVSFSAGGSPEARAAEARAWIAAWRTKQQKQEAGPIADLTGDSHESRVAEARAWISAWRTKQQNQEAVGLTADLTGDILLKAIEFQLQQAAETKSRKSSKKVNPARQTAPGLSTENLKKAIDTQLTRSTEELKTRVNPAAETAPGLSPDVLQRAIELQLTRAAKKNAKTQNPAVVTFAEVQTDVLSKAIETQLRRAAETAAKKTNAAVQWATLGEAELARAIATQLKQASERQQPSSRGSQTAAAPSGSSVQEAAEKASARVNAAMRVVQMDEATLAKAIQRQLEQAEGVRQRSREVMRGLRDRVPLMEESSQQEALKRQTLQQEEEAARVKSAAVLKEMMDRVPMMERESEDTALKRQLSSGSSSNGNGATPHEEASPYEPCETFEDGSVMYTSAALSAVNYDDVIEQ